MAYSWHIEDVVDLEHFLKTDGEGDGASVRSRDRDLFLNRIAPALGVNDLSDTTAIRKALRLWLDERRGTDSPTKATGRLPGTVFRDVLSISITILLAVGLLSGISLSFAVLRYQGSEPVNVSVYLGCFVLLQILLVALLCLWWLIRPFAKPLHRLAFLQTIVGTALAGVFKRLAVRSKAAFPAESRNHISALIGGMQGHSRIYGAVFYWRMLRLVQAFGIGFNAGVIGGSMLKIVGSDLAFGWQSTLRLSSQAVYRFVEMLSSPWSWLVPSHMAHPSLEQIHGSRMVLKDGIYALTTPDLVSWWPFLVLSVLCYGLLPRALLYVYSIAAERTALNRLVFTHAGCRRLISRLTTPHLETDGGSPQRSSTYQTVSTASRDTLQTTRSPAVLGSSPLLLIPEDTAASLPDGLLSQLANRIQGPEPLKQALISLEFGADREALAKVLPLHADEPLPEVVLLQEAWQPPIDETLSYLRHLTGWLSSRTRLLICLIGKVIPGNGLHPVGDADMKTWKQAIASLGDPAIDVYTLENNR